MSKNDRFRHAVRGVWENSHAVYTEWSDEQRAALQPAVDALLAWLADAASEGDLIARYWEVGDPPGQILKPHLPADLDAADALTVQEACFWRRINELEAEAPGA
ncbi:MAG: hypothetical protein KC461_13255 [Dehalococcoidia bacterium]|nr:hypothetical protein [Dehalococcoidia bacterium]MCA9851595.1 hypothetical protein [Dehalococcoidia bacterium]